MNSLDTTPFGSFNKDKSTSTPEQISSYVMSALSGQSVALGGGLPDINSKATSSGIAIGLSASSHSESVVIGVKAKDQNISHSNVVAIGAYSSANNWGCAVGTNAYADYGTAIGTDTRAEKNTSLALGRYAQVSAEFATQINGNQTKTIVNTENGTLKFYTGTGTNNVTIVDANGHISADALNNEAKIQIGNTQYNISVAKVLDTDNTEISVLQLKIA